MEYKEDENDQLVIISKQNGQCFGFHALRTNQDKNDDQGVMYRCIAVTDLIVYQLSSDNLQRYQYLHCLPI